MTEIEKIVIKVGDNRLTLTVEDAKKLHEVLQELFPGKQWTMPYPITAPYPVYIERYWRERPFWETPWTCTSGVISHEGSSIVCSTT